MTNGCSSGLAGANWVVTFAEPVARDRVINIAVASIPAWEYALCLLLAVNHARYKLFLNSFAGNARLN